jgi:4-aminobutyrate--pyruvate transaminase
MNVVEHVRKMGARLRAKFEALAEKSPIVGEVRGAGLMLGIELVADKKTRKPFDPAKQAGMTFDTIAYENGLIGRCMGDTLGFAPPLIVTESDVDEIAALCEKSLATLEQKLAKA